MNPLTRRDLLKFVGAGALAAALPATLRAQEKAPATAAQKPRANSAITRFSVGDWEAFSLTAGIFKAPNAHPLFAPQATPAEFKQALEDEGLPADPLALYLSVLLLRNGKDTILVDAGLPGKQQEPFDVLANLGVLGLKPADITAVFLTHAHFDHMGGMLDDAGKPVFTRAEHFCLEQEKAFWTSPDPDFSTSRSDKPGIEAGIKAARRTFDAIPFTTLKDGARLFGDITMIHAPGHTPGHMNLRVDSKGQSLCHISDLVHHFAIMLPHPDWTVGFDINETQAAATRKRILAQLAAERTPTFGYHLPPPALGLVKAQGQGYRWIPRLWEPGT